MLKESKLRNMYEDRVILVVGGLGSIGSGIVTRLLNYNAKEVRIFDNRETELFYFIQKYKNLDRVSFTFGDVRDIDRLLEITDNVDIIFHTAAMKHVVICEHNPFEAVKTNVIGTQNVIKCALNHNIEKMILISTDKAVNPTNVMGATKLLGERIVSAMCFHKGENKTEFGVVRFGNVLASSGSVLEVWENQLKKGRKITVTNPDMTRFFMSVPNSVKLIFDAINYAKNGEVLILKMSSVRIGDLAEAFLELKGYPLNHYDIIGERLGEKMHEELIFRSERGLLLENEELFVRLPLIFTAYRSYSESSEYKRFIELGFKKSDVEELLSNNKKSLLKKEEVKALLTEILNSERA